MDALFFYIFNWKNLRTGKREKNDLFYYSTIELFENEFSLVIFHFTGIDYTAHVPLHLFECRW